jgi:hypothetical protein
MSKPRIHQAPIKIEEVDLSADKIDLKKPSKSSLPEAKTAKIMPSDSIVAGDFSEYKVESGEVKTETAPRASPIPQIARRQAVDPPMEFTQFEIKIESNAPSTPKIATAQPIEIPLAGRSYVVGTLQRNEILSDQIIINTSKTKAAAKTAHTFLFETELAKNMEIPFIMTAKGFEAASKGGMLSRTPNELREIGKILQGLEQTYKNTLAGKKPSSHYPELINHYCNTLTHKIHRAMTNEKMSEKQISALANLLVAVDKYPRTINALFKVEIKTESAIDTPRASRPR